MLKQDSSFRNVPVMFSALNSGEVLYRLLCSGNRACCIGSALLSLSVSSIAAFWKCGRCVEGRALVRTISGWVVALGDPVGLFQPWWFYEIAAL